MTDPDELVKRLVLLLLQSRDFGWKQEFDGPEHFLTCPNITISEIDTAGEMWFDTGVEATRITATLECPHESSFEWEWADLGELPDLLDQLEKIDEDRALPPWMCL